MRKGTIVGTLLGAAVGAVAGSTVTNKKVIDKNKKVKKFKNYYKMLNEWLRLKQEGKSLEEYFLKNEYKTVAIYGMGEMGNRLYDELKNTDIEVKYAIDEKAEETYADITVYEKDDELPLVDVVIVTATFAFDEIEEELCEKIDMPIVSLEEVVYTMDCD